MATVASTESGLASTRSLLVVLLAVRPGSHQRSPGPGAHDGCWAEATAMGAPNASTWTKPAAVLGFTVIFLVAPGASVPAPAPAARCGLPAPAAGRGAGVTWVRRVAGAAPTLVTVTAPGRRGSVGQTQRPA